MKFECECGKIFEDTWSFAAHSYLEHLKFDKKETKSKIIFEEKKSSTNNT